MTQREDRGSGDDQSGEGSDRREYFRVLTHLPVRCRKVDAQEESALADAIRHRHAPDLSKVEPALALWLDRIEEKLDRLLVHMGLGDDVALGEADVQEVLLSGAGMTLRSSEDPPPESLLLLELELPGPPVQRVTCLARLVRVLPPKTAGDPVSLAVTFEVIHEGDREQIVHHVVEVQRRMLRSRSARERGE